MLGKRSRLVLARKEMREARAKVRENGHQKLPTGPSTDALDHLLAEVPKDHMAPDYVSCSTYNSYIKDSSRLVCYVCGGPGHFMEACDLYLYMNERVSHHGLRKAIWGKLISKLVEKHGVV